MKDCSNFGWAYKSTVSKVAAGEAETEGSLRSLKLLLPNRCGTVNANIPMPTSAAAVIAAILGFILKLSLSDLCG